MTLNENTFSKRTLISGLMIECLRTRYAPCSRQMSATWQQSRQSRCKLSEYPPFSSTSLLWSGLEGAGQSSVPVRKATTTTTVAEKLKTAVGAKKCTITTSGLPTYLSCRWQRLKILFGVIFHLCRESSFCCPTSFGQSWREAGWMLWSKQSMETSG